jgi:SOS-response transcriptional repressor LexA
MSTKPLTKVQMQVLNFMHLYFHENDQLPPPDALQEYFGWKSPNAVTCAREALERKGWIERNAAGKYRFARNKVAP